MACAYERRDFIGIDQDADYVEIARARIEYAVANAGKEAVATVELEDGAEEHEVEPVHMQAPLMQLLKEMEGEDE